MNKEKDGHKDLLLRFLSVGSLSQNRYPAIKRNWEKFPITIIIERRPNTTVL